MNIWEKLHPDRILLNAACKDKLEALRFISKKSAETGVVNNAAKLFDGMINREKTMSTGIGKGIGFPHTASDEAVDAAILLLRLQNPIEFDSLDGLPVDVLIAIVIPAQQTTLHLQLLASVSRLCKNSEFLEMVRSSDDVGRLIQAIKRIEEQMICH